MKEANLYTLSRASELHFIFAGFFDAEPLVFIRLGHSAQPYRTMAGVARMAPWPLIHAVIAHIGDLERAQRFERFMAHRLDPHRTHGDWFCFDDGHGHDFAAVARLTYAEITGHRLEWRDMPISVPAARISP